ncbi:MAG: hypothetical protein WCD79_20920 [Chthoniobacteraceae bacterium]
MKDSGEHDDLWQLLGKSKTPAVSPYFARNVLREIRACKPEKAGVLGWLSGHWRIASLGSIAAVLLALNSAQFFVPQKARLAIAPAQSPQTIASATAPTKTDYEVIKNLDELVAYEDHSIWLDDSTQ